MNKLKSAEKKLIGKIMSCDTYIKVYSDKVTKEEMLNSIDLSFDHMRTFENKFSRFLDRNELSAFNNSQETISVSDDLFDMLILSKKLYDQTNHIFDIGILPSLLDEGYVKSKTLGYIDFGFKPKVQTNKSSIDNIKILGGSKVYKPKSVQVDLGGIGKGYIIDKISQELSKTYSNYLVDAGGDMYCSGVDSENNKDYWAVTVESPIDSSKEIALLTVKNKGVATSGVNRRKWNLNGFNKNHLIDPRTQQSVQNDLLTVTVVSELAVNSDVLAKSLLIMGKDEGINFSQKNKIASMFIDKDLNIFKSAEMEKYVWKD